MDLQTEQQEQPCYEEGTVHLSCYKVKLPNGLEAAFFPSQDDAISNTKINTAQGVHGRIV